MDKNELKVYRFEATCLKKNEDGTVSEERETLACGYAFEGDPSPRIEYNSYWNFGSGCVSFVSKDGKPVEPDVNSEIEWMNDVGFRGVDIRKMVDGLDAPGRWAEVCLGDAAKTTLRVTRLQGLPELDPEATIRNSDLSPAQQHRVKIDGVPLFPEGGTVNALNPKTPTLVLRPNLGCEIDKVWEEFIRIRCGALVRVTVDTTCHSADSEAVKLTIKAPTREDLDGALCAIGVLHPKDVEPDVVDGEGDKPTGFTATVILTTDV